MKINMKKEITKVVIITTFGLFSSITYACECPVKTGDHVLPLTDIIIMSNTPSHWHCGYVESIFGKCGEWKILINTCADKKIQTYSSYVKVLNIQKENKSCWNFLNKSITPNDIENKKD